MGLILQVGARCLALAVHGAVHNVEINLKQITDVDFKTTIQEKASLVSLRKTSIKIQVFNSNLFLVQEVEKAEKYCKMVLDSLNKRE